MTRRRSDRWLTPAVVIVGIIAAALVVVAVAVLVAYMVARGIDPAPVVQLAGTAAAGVTSLGTLILQLVGRRSQTKTERAAGILAAELSRTNSTAAPAAAELAAGAVPTEQHPFLIDDRGLPPVPPARRRRVVDQVDDDVDSWAAHRWPEHWPANGNGPDAAGEAENRAR